MIRVYILLNIVPINVDKSRFFENLKYFLKDVTENFKRGTKSVVIHNRRALNAYVKIFCDTNAQTLRYLYAMKTDIILDRRIDINAIKHIFLKRISRCNFEYCTIVKAFIGNTRNVTLHTSISWGSL